MLKTTEEREKNCKTNTVIVWVLGFAIIGYVFVRILSPVFSYSTERADQFKVQILQKELGDKNFLLVTPTYDYPYNKIKIEARGDFSESFEEIVVYKGCLSQFYPLGKPVESRQELDEYLFFANDTSLPNGTIVSFNDAIFFVSKGQRRPFLSPETFLRLGFDWDDVVSDENQLLATMKEGEKIDFVSPHPDGTLLRTKEGETFLVWDEKRLLIEDEQLAEEISHQVHVVDIGSNKIVQVGSCAKQKQTLGGFSCSFVPAEVTRENIGQTYLFEVPAEVASSIEKAWIKFDLLGKADLQIAGKSLKHLKDVLYLKYGEYLY